MSSKEKVLAAIRKQTVPSVELPSLDKDWIKYPDVTSQFSLAVASVGGEAVSCGDFVDAERYLRELPAFRDAKSIYCQPPQMQIGNVDIEQTDDPHRLEDLDFAVFNGEFGVAENGAIWLNASTLRHRAAYFIAQHLAIVVPADQLLHNMHEAYQRLEFGERRFGVFVSGPSKTADIEQSLVIGAHGARSLNVLLVGQCLLEL